MKVVMTLRTRDQADVVDAAVAFHLNAGVDFVIATDHRSRDGTDEILAAYAREGVLRLIREPGEEVRGAEWRTRMARLAAVEHGADWVFGADGDELWWPRGGSFRDVLGAVPGRFGIVRCPMREFVVRPEDGTSFAERMTVRFSSPVPVNDPASAFRPQLKVAHRADAGVTVHRGSHAVYSTPLRALPGWHPIEVLHFPVRSEEQLERKVVAWRGAVGERAHRSAHAARRRGRFSEHYAARVVGDAELREGLERGVLAVDTRLRDALRELRLPEPAGLRAFALPSEGGRLAFAAPDSADAAGWAAECQALEESLVVRLSRDADLLAARVDALETAARGAGGGEGPDRPDHRYGRGA